MTRYAVIYEPTGTGYSAYGPDLLGCIATGSTLEERRCRMHEAIEVHVVVGDASRHLGSMREDGDHVPEPALIADMPEVA
jgi:predicted RNase H-like HicB family nuclease